MEDNPTGTLSKSKMMEMYSSVLSIHKATKFVEEIFLKYDTDNNGFIDFKVWGSIQYKSFKNFMFRNLCLQPSQMNLQLKRNSDGLSECMIQTPQAHYLEPATRYLLFFSSGTIDSKEMAEIFGSMYEEHGLSMVIEEWMLWYASISYRIQLGRELLLYSNCLISIMMEKSMKKNLCRHNLLYNDGRI